MFYFSLYLFVLFETIFNICGNQDGRVRVYSTYVSFDNDTQVFSFHDSQDTYSVVVAHLNNETVNQTGWTYLEVNTLDVDVNDSVLAYAAGLAEGFLTRQLINMHWQNILNSYCDEPLNQYCLRLRDFLSKNLAWVREKISANPSDPYWHQVCMFYTQQKGLSDAYHGKAMSGSISLDIDPLDIYLLQLYFDLHELEQILNAKEVIKKRQNDHCSAIVKLLPHYKNLYTAHNSWTGYNTMLRVLKKYSLKYHTTEDRDFKYPKGTAWTFSSYPGYFTSADDFHILSSQMVTMETSIDNFNKKRWNLVKPNGIVMEPVRAWTANKLAETGQDWVDTFARYNSGTYNNQWMVIDYKLFEPGSSNLKPGTLIITEQLPGFIKSADVTEILKKQGYWASYNQPYFEEVYNMSGYPEMLKMYGDIYSYKNCPRAKIFKRDQASITDRKSLYKFMRYNNYLHDPLSRCDTCTPIQNAAYAISARNDLNPRNGTYPLPIQENSMFGATDVKIVSYMDILWMLIEAASGPTFEQVPPFQWSKQSEDDNVRHFGQPDLFQFSPVYFNGTNLPLNE